jgi:hypothetical protein
MRTAVVAPIVLAALVLAALVWLWWKRWGREAFTGDCQEPWATCPSGPPFCYWGDKVWNKGRCCPKPWSGPEECRDPNNVPPVRTVSAQALAVYNAPLPALASVSSPNESWNSATATWYKSYPECCKPDYRGSDMDECRKYSGCKYQGMFAGLNGKMPESWVQNNNIVAVWEGPNSRNRAEWNSKWKNKRLRIRNPSTGKVMEVMVVDTCDDGDCKGCCSRNAGRHGSNILIDLEINTARRFYDGNVQDVAKIEWQLV